ncbi:hypothetical protein Sme01_59180 [Sphaerisporangium melleum]|uniref:Lipopolysaccharide assembly protein A domain-containing protein n=1 Tax=Sphaerisporangium melleum TaxID=321316 RepID=A0A917VKF2_9ACTN|nr:hypothetical protein [Sphaerisporangium melleum]GGK93166.1 hypothetical protein GCM10007964_39570 [Sphaerisporangium melleum]GII73442.1 hypothetical protein Sme01_59180 [Sphaerisporangium melleum]
MIVLGLLLIVLAGAALVAVANDETGGIAASVTVLDRTLQLSKLELFLAGAATAALFLIGLMVLTAGMRRAGARRKKLREARVETRDRVARLEEEKRRLERRLEDERASAPAATAPDGRAATPTPAGRHAHVPDGDGVDGGAEGPVVPRQTDRRAHADGEGQATVPTRGPETHAGDQLVAGHRADRDASV